MSNKVLKDANNQLINIDSSNLSSFSEDVVHKTGDETISGQKIFIGGPSIRDSNGATALKEMSFIYNRIYSYGTNIYCSSQLVFPNNTTTGKPYVLTLPSKTGTLACLYKHSISFEIPVGSDDYDYYSFTIIAPIDTIANTKTNLISLFDNAISIIDTSTTDWKKPVVAWNVDSSNFKYYVNDSNMITINWNDIESLNDSVSSI